MLYLLGRRQASRGRGSQLCDSSRGPKGRKSVQLHEPLYEGRSLGLASIENVPRQSHSRKLPRGILPCEPGIEMGRASWHGQPVVLACATQLTADSRVGFTAEGTRYLRKVSRSPPEELSGMIQSPKRFLSAFSRIRPFFDNSLGKVKNDLHNVATRLLRSLGLASASKITPKLQGIHAPCDSVPRI